MSLPKALMYDNAIKASYAKNFITILNCQNTNNHSTGSTAIINIPCQNNQVLSWNDTVLKMKMKLTAGAAASTCVLDRAGVAGAIQRVRIFANGVLINDLDNYGNLITQLTSFQESHDTLQGKLAVLQGTDSDLKGKVFAEIAAGDTNGGLDVAFPLMTCLGSSDRYFPTYALAGGSLRMEIQFVSSVTKFVNATSIAGMAATFEGVQLCANFVELSDSGMRIVKEASGPSTDFVCGAYTNYVHNSNINAAGSQLSVPIPARFNSLNALYVTQRESVVANGAQNRFPYDSVKLGLSEYRTQIGSVVIPTEPPTSVPQFLSETERSLSSVSNSMSQSSYRLAQIEANKGEAAGQNRSNCFLVGVETQSYASQPMNSSYSGLNTTQSDIYFRPTYTADGAGDMRLDAYASYDQLISISEGGDVSVQY
tara:strand:- start:1680 stop:2954 length:1275 start_codon:yes stop_codon:yes gene_type:complete